jgi:putative flippase GtrA
MTMMARLVRFGGVGLASGVASLMLYAGLRAAVDAQSANAVASIVVGLANAVANQRLTFGAAGRGATLRHLGPSLALLGFGTALSAAALAALQAVAPDASRTAELAVVIASGLTGGLLRFAVLNGITISTRATRAA